jgi:hypothetical protein
VASAGFEHWFDGPAIAWTGNDVVITATDNSGNLDFWWQRDGTVPWNQETVATGYTEEGYFEPAIAWTGGAALITAVDNGGNLWTSGGSSTAVVTGIRRPWRLKPSRAATRPARPPG